MGRFMSARHAGMEMRVIKLRMSDPKVQQELLSAPFHRWSSEDGSDWCFFYRFDSEYLLRFPDLADFSINSPTLDIMCSPVPGVSGAVLTQLYFNQILPLVQSHSGELVFHAGRPGSGGPEKEVLLVLPNPFSWMRRLKGQAR